MLRLYHCNGSRSLRALWTLSELNKLDKVEVITIPFPPRIFQKDYLDINPLGTIPCLVGDGVFMTESTAISLYFAEKFKEESSANLIVTPTEQDYPSFINWLHHSDATLTFPQTLVLRYGIFEPQERRSAQVVEDYTKWYIARLKLLDNSLQDGRQYLCESRFTVADIAITYALMLGETLGLEGKYPSAVRKYMDTHKQRPAFQAVNDMQKLKASL
eukprot:m.136874 g.136874  ORF g.136874 m.136874 type:complete len:216 (-) comp14739_c0_seq4:38-685(-)